MAQVLTIQTTNLVATIQFPEYIEPTTESPEYIDIMASNSNEGIPTPRLPTNKTIEEVSRTSSRHPSPQPAHFSVPHKNGNGNGHRVLRSATVGYIAPEFKGKKEQMLQGE